MNDIRPYESGQLTSMFLRFTEALNADNGHLIWAEFNSLDIMTENLATLVAYVRYTYWSQTVVPNWHTMLNRVRQEIIRRGDGDRVDQILHGLYDPLTEIPEGVRMISAMAGMKLPETIDAKPETD